MSTCNECRNFKPIEPKQLKYNAGDCLVNNNGRKKIYSLEFILTKELKCQNWKLLYPKVVVDAIKESWRGWDRTSRGLEDKGDCPVCVMFITGNFSNKRCLECPIHQKTGKHYCRGTPFADWHANKTHENALVVRDWIGKLLPNNIVAELKKEVEPVKEKCPCCGAELKSLKKG